jgi:hypothetical protein
MKCDNMNDLVDLSGDTVRESEFKTLTLYEVICLYTNVFILVERGNFCNVRVFR